MRCRWCITCSVERFNLVGESVRDFYGDDGVVDGVDLHLSLLGGSALGFGSSGRRWRYPLCMLAVERLSLVFERDREF